MCDPVTAAIAVGVTTVASSVGQVVAQSKSAKAQTKAIRSQQALMKEETRREASAQLFDQMRAARREQGKVRVSAGEAGLGLNSGSVEGLLYDTAMQMEQQGGRTLANMESRHASNTAEAASALSRIQKPTALGAGLQIGSSMASAFSGVQGAKLQVAQGVPPTGT